MNNDNRDKDSPNENIPNINNTFDNLFDMFNQDIEKFEVLRNRAREASSHVHAVSDNSQAQLNALRNLYQVLTTHGFIFNFGCFIEEISKSADGIDKAIKFRVNELGLH